MLHCVHQLLTNCVCQCHVASGHNTNESGQNSEAKTIRWKTLKLPTGVCQVGYYERPFYINGQVTRIKLRHCTFLKNMDTWQLYDCQSGDHCSRLLRDHFQLIIYWIFSTRQWDILQLSLWWQIQVFFSHHVIFPNPKRVGFFCLN